MFTDALGAFAESNLFKISRGTHKYASSVDLIYEAGKSGLNKNSGSPLKATCTLVVEGFDQPINGMTFGVVMKVKDTIR
ncbi:hypothetical protein [Yoonia maricola]|uniref:hypothetical protein n=1 Tax=Yoonia maricola TaxID=420999 RepID=UPI000C23C69C|nr:hypothetical protein [Yoonia maricola]